jgi:hypothetical protein
MEKMSKTIDEEEVTGSLPSTSEEPGTVEDTEPSTPTEPSTSEEPGTVEDTEPSTPTEPSTSEEPGTVEDTEPSTPTEPTEESSGTPDAEEETEGPKEDVKPEEQDPEADSDESDIDKRMRAKMEERIDASISHIKELRTQLKGRNLDSVQEASVQRATDLEDKRDELQKKRDAGEMTAIEFTRELTPMIEALEKIIEAWERTTHGQVIASEQSKAEKTEE